jgi:hypothetical protein
LGRRTGGDFRSRGADIDSGVESVSQIAWTASHVLNTWIAKVNETLACKVGMIDNTLQVLHSCQTPTNSSPRRCNIGTAESFPYPFLL